MEKWLRIARVTLSTLAAWLSRLLGGWDTALSMMFLMMVLDVLTGVLCALVKKSAKTASGGFESAAAFRGMTRKMLMIVIVMLANACDLMLGSEVCRLASIGFYAANEGMSILENAAALGVPIPKVIRKQLDGLSGEKEQKQDE